MAQRKSKQSEDGGEDTAPMLPMEARLADALPEDPGWQYEPKWDGFRCLAFKSSARVALYSKAGRPLHRYFPEVVANLSTLSGTGWVLDGELTIAVGGALSFDALQLRLHPAESRIRKLAQDTPAELILFDMPAGPRGIPLVGRPLAERRAALEAFVAESGAGAGVVLSPFTRDVSEARAWLSRAGGAIDGVVAKRLDGPYESGERAMIKVKRIRSADCVVGGFRYASNDRLVGSLLLGLYNAAGHLDHVGFTATISNGDREGLTHRLEALRGGPGFTGKAPGGPSRWSTERSGQYEALHHELVVEVSYDHVSGERFRHGTRLLRWRPDKAPAQCTFEQLEQGARPLPLVSEIEAGQRGVP